MQGHNAFILTNCQFLGKRICCTYFSLIDGGPFPGCSGGIGKGNYSNGAGSGAGHGGRGGFGYFNGRVSAGGNKYGDADLPCELGSGTEGPNQLYGHVVGGGMIGNISKLTPVFHQNVLLPFD